MRYLALASDYDGTLAHQGRVSEETLQWLERFRHSGRRLILVTGRELPELEEILPRLDLFHYVVAENGGLLFRPDTREKRPLTSVPPPEFIADLQQRGVADLSAGETIVATWRHYETAILESIRDLGLDLQLIFNKDAVMILPSGVDKMTGLEQALEDLGLSRHNVIGVGDAENDDAFLSCCQFSVAVANAIPALKERVDWVTEGERGAGVQELIREVLKDELESLLCGQSGGGRWLRAAPP